MLDSQSLLVHVTFLCLKESELWARWAPPSRAKLQQCVGAVCPHLMGSCPFMSDAEQNVSVIKPTFCALYGGEGADMQQFHYMVEEVENVTRKKKVTKKLNRLFSSIIGLLIWSVSFWCFIPFSTTYPKPTKDRCLN